MSLDCGSDSGRRSASGPVEPGAGSVVAYIGVGSNKGEAREQCREALMRLGSHEGVAFLRHSSFYRSEPVGVADQDWFVNAVGEIRTALGPSELLGLLKTIEKSMGREEGKRWGPRIIDLDILLYGQAVVDGPELVIPHRELHRRRFVLVPLNELASYAIHPLYGLSVRGLLERCEDLHVVDLIGEGAG
ncbi:MAG: 2-amino-4-hydroxy-6-hydroxymethyldihydropteridine diphosphokinase [Deltaproteobacteria bacterium]|nr:2-amino-4-hydroxy-6-hydroxymethyldihydropteridine diphosphokinase [Deltaproteobacteria bacterium]